MANELLTTSQHIRLECVKLAFRHDRSSEDAVAKAEVLEKYVTGDDAKAPSVDGQGEPDAPI